MILLILTYCQFRASHPKATVYNQSCNLLLKHAHEVFEGKSPEPLRSLHRQSEELPSLPMPGEVDFICGGENFLIKLRKNNLFS